MAAVAAYVMSIAPVTWLLMSESFPNHVRGKGMAIASTALCIAFVAKLVFPLMTENSENYFGSVAGAFWPFAVNYLETFIFCRRLVPGNRRTKSGRNLRGRGRRRANSPRPNRKLHSLFAAKLAK
jgi:MFS family permease